MWSVNAAGDWGPAEVVSCSRMPQPLPLLKRQRSEPVGVSLQPTWLPAALAASLHPSEAFRPVGMEGTPVGGLFSQSLQEGLEMQKSAAMLLGVLSALRRFQVPLSSPAVP